MDIIFLQAGGDAYGTIIWFLMFFVLIFLYPRMMLSQMIYSLEKSATQMETLSKKANHIVAKKISHMPTESLKKSIDDFTEFFVVAPSSMDPFGIVRKIDTTIRQMESRFSDFVNGVTKKDRDEINYGLRAAISLRQIAKIVRHYVETTKKYKNLQIAMILKMQMPIIAEIARSELKGAEAFLNQWPVGDGAGPLAVMALVDKMKPIATDVVYSTTSINGRKIFVLKADGPSPSLGRIDEAIDKIMKKNKISRIITVDAGLKLEGEKTGTVAEGVGFAMGGWAEREIIENSVLAKKIPLDSIIVKVGIEDAIAPMKKEIYDAVPKVHELIERSVNRTKRGSKVILIGVGNSCGVANSKKELKNIKDVVEKLDKKANEEKAKGKKGSWF
ncbi:MAG: DUF1512 family protein [Candidatus Aenigmatarchaeota archaeon]